MSANRLFLLGLICLPLLILRSAVALEVEDAHSAGCLPPASVQHQACAACHKDAPKRWAANQSRPCTPYCATCHKKTETERHHPVGVVLPKAPEEGLPLLAGNKMACATCHDLSKPRFDSVRWKAASLFDRIFREELRYKTFFLSHRNDKGQLCLSCH